MEAPVVVRRVERRFGDRPALRGVDLEVEPGRIVGLVGPNGSGKTTLLRLVGGFLRPDAGEVRVFGSDPFRDQPRVMRRARFAFAPPALFETLTASEHLRYLAGLRAPDMPVVGPADVERALERVGLAERAHERVRGFSFGMRQRLVLAQALLPTPELIVLDEPTDGLDPLAVLELRAILRELRDEHGLAVLLSSHLLIEIEELVDHMLVLFDGRALFQGAPAEMIAGRSTLRLGVDDVEAAGRVLAEHGLVGRVRGDPGELEVADTEALDLEGARRLLAGAGVCLTSFRRHAPSLEEALLERLRDEGGTR